MVTDNLFHISDPKFGFESLINEGKFKLFGISMIDPCQIYF